MQGTQAAVWDRPNARNHKPIGSIFVCSLCARSTDIYVQCLHHAAICPQPGSKATCMLNAVDGNHQRFAAARLQQAIMQ